MKRITICLLLVLFSTAIVYAEVTRKSILNPDGTIEYIFYDDGKEIAKQKVDDNGNIIQTTGKIPDGTVKGYDESGKLVYECNYKDNKLEGIVQVYYESGELFKELNYKSGKLEGIAITYYKNGELSIEENYKDGKLEGIKKGYHRNGEIENIRTYKNGYFVK